MAHLLCCGGTDNTLILAVNRYIILLSCDRGNGRKVNIALQTNLMYSANVKCFQPYYLFVFMAFIIYLLFIWKVFNAPS